MEAWDQLNSQVPFHSRPIAVSHNFMASNRRTVLFYVFRGDPYKKIEIWGTVQLEIFFLRRDFGVYKYARR